MFRSRSKKSRSKRSRSTGSALFRGKVPPRLENFQFLQGLGIEVQPRPAGPEHVWAARARHPQWGEADLLCPRNPSSPPREHFSLGDRDLVTEDEAHAISLCGSYVDVVMEHGGENPCHERKLALRMLHAVLGDDGVAVADHDSGHFWPRAALEEELAHDAALDIERLFVVHVVRGEADDAGPVWFHTHGLAELGYFDFDILEPSSEVIDRSCPVPRAIAFGIVEGWIEADSDDVQILQPDGRIRMVPAEVFQRRAPTRFVAMRDDPDGYHSTSRSVVCAPAKRSLARLFRDRVEPCDWLRRPLAENSLITSSTAATNMRAQRARDTYPLCRRYFEELADLEIRAAVKVGIPTDAESGAGREHLWFEVTKLDSDTLTGILLNDPWYIASLVKGEAYGCRVDALSDWYIATPEGRITPYTGMAARRLRARRDELVLAVQPATS